MSGSDEGRIGVLMLPDYRRENPYQALLAAALEPHGVEVGFPRGYRRVFPIWRAALDAGDKPQIVHLHWMLEYLKGAHRLTKALYAVKLLLDLGLVKLSGCRVVWTVHNLLSHEAAYPRIELWTRRRLARMADCLIVHDEDAADRVAASYGVARQEISVIPHGHYRGAYGGAMAPREARESLELPPHGRVFLFLGMLRPYKGVERLLASWRSSPALHAKNHLVIAGKPQDEDYAKRLSVEAVHVPNVRLISAFIKDADIPKFLSAADVVVLPFRRMLTSGSVILAMSYDKPVIAPRIAGLLALLEGATDLLYEDNDEAGLRRALERALEIDTVDLGASVRAACNRLGWNPIAEAVRDQYQDALAR